MTAAILFAFASATFLGAAVVTSQLGLRTMEPLSGAAVSVPAFTLLFLVLSPLLLAGTIADISARKRIEIERRQWADAFENCAHGIALGVPASNQIMVCNPAFARMLGRSTSQLAGMQIFRLYAPEDHEHVRARIVEADRAGHATYEARIGRPVQDLAWYEALAKPGWTPPNVVFRWCGPCST